MFAAPLNFRVESMPIQSAVVSGKGNVIIQDGGQIKKKMNVDHHNAK
jgi:hypothetical protein